jgi:hypothetical protein
MDLSTQLLFIPRALFREYVAVPAVAVLILAGVAYWLVKGWKEAGIRVALLYALLNFTGTELVTQKDARFVWGAVAVATALAGAFIACAIPRWPRWAGVPTGVLVAAGLIGSIWAAPASARRFFADSQVAPTAAEQATLLQGLNFIRENTRPRQPLLVAGVADGGINLGMIQQFVMDPATGQLPAIADLPYAKIPAAWGFSPAPSPEYAQFLAKAVHDDPDAAVVILYHEPGSPFRGRLYPWILAWQENYITAAAESKDLQAAARLDTHAGLTVTIYQRASDAEKPGR